MQRKVLMGELKYIVMDGCMLLNKSSTLSVKTAKTSSSIHWCQNFDLNCRKTEKSSQTKLATGACNSDWIFFAFDNFPPCIPQCNTHWIFPQDRAPVAGQSEALPFGPCCSCSFYWTRDAFLKLSQSYDMVGWQQVSLLILTEHFEVNTEMARRQ